MAFHDKKEGATHSYYYEKMKDNLTGLPFSLFEYSTELNEMVAIVPHTAVLECADLTDKAKEVLKGIELCEDDNPFLYFVKLRE